MLGSVPAAWRTPLIIVVAGCVIGAVTNGPRAALGLFATPILDSRTFGIEVYSLAMAVQNLVWGMGQPFAGAIADRYGAPRVLAVGLVLTALGFASMVVATDPVTFTLSAGGLIGFGASGAAFLLVLGAFGKLLPPEKRPMAFGFGTAAGSFGQFLFAPLASLLIREIGWQGALVTFAVMILAILPLTLFFAAPQSTTSKPTASNQSLKSALAEAFGHRSYLLLVAGFFVCGFHVAFITIHLPKYLVDKGLTAEIGGWTVALIGLFNIVGSLGAGYLMTRMPKRWLLAAIYFLRAVAIAALMLLPMSPALALAFGAAMGLLWLSTVPPTNGLVAVMFGNQWAAMLFGFTFFSHQVGAFLGLTLAGWARATTGSYDIVWIVGILLGLFAAIVHVPIRERAIERPATQAA